jgi:nucleoside-diphosphate-sugar epimerase
MKTEASSLAPSTSVLVTGGNGYLGSWIVTLLLAEGHTVHATVRNLRDRSRYAHLENAAKTGGKLFIHEADLLNQGSFDAAMAGCEIVIHSASPFATKGVKNAQKELIDPAVNGTRNVLAAANRTASVKRVVLTSSVAAIYSDATDLNQPPRRALSEDDWNTTSSADYQPYAYSKTFAEREAWRIAGQQNRWNLVVLNPGFMLGPAVNPDSTSVSQTIMRNFGDGTFKSGMVDIWYGVVDVRDVAQSHLNAAFQPHTSGRSIISNRTVSLLDIAAILREQFGDSYPFPKRKVPKWVLWLFPKAFGFTRRYVKHNVGISFELDNGRSKRSLGLTYRPLETTVREHFNQVSNDVLGARAKTTESPRGVRGSS